MKTAFALALVAGASAQLAMDGLMPFLLMDGLGGGSYYYSAPPAYHGGRHLGHHGGHRSYYSNRGGLGDIGMLAALGGLGGAGAGLTASNAAYLVASQNGGFRDNLPLLAASGAFGADFLGGNNAALPLLMGGGGSNSMALLAATGGLGVDSASMMLPLMVNSMSYGRSPSLSRDVIPAMALTGMTPTTENLLPFMMTSGGRYMGGNYGMLAAAGGLGGVTADSMMPWILADNYGSSYYAPRHMGHHAGHVAPRPAYHAGHAGHIAPAVAPRTVMYSGARVGHAGHGLGHGLGHGFGHGLGHAAPRTVLYSSAPVGTTIV